MGYLYYNPNPLGRRVGDCTVRAISKVTSQTWDESFTGLCDMGMHLKDMPSANQVWSAYLESLGFHRIEIEIPQTIMEFSVQHPNGVYVAATGRHVVAVVDGNYYDSWDSGEKFVSYAWERN